MTLAAVSLKQESKFTNTTHRDEETIVFDHGENNNLIHKLIPLASCQVQNLQIIPLMGLKVF
jgi:uncharacterized Rossmann fold enzyme